MSDKQFPLFAPGDILDIDGIEFVDVVLYAVIYGLCRTTGCCFASNAYLANRLKICTRSIQRSMKRLHGFNLIFAEFDDNNRRIFLVRHDQLVTGVTTDESHQDPSSIFLINKINKQRLNFEDQIIEAYKTYPIKKGKTVGVKKLSKQIKSEEDLELLKKAIQNYALECKDKEPQYIKHFSTFASCWQDFIELDTKSKPTFAAFKMIDGKLVSVTDDK
jgi:Helix-turn-helix domain